MAVVAGRSVTGDSTVRFYDADHTSSAEAARLRGMAGAADRLTLTALSGIVDQPGVVVADVGCGESTSLGVALAARNGTLTYVPIDIRPEAVHAHRMRGFDGRVGSATDLPVADRTVDVLHVRFVFGWLDDAGRSRAIEELLRVSIGAGRIVIIDSDWSTAAGPDVVLLLKEKILQLLLAFGFDPHYGRRLPVDVGRHLADAGFDPTETTAELLAAMFGRQAIRPFGDTVGTITLTGTGVRPGGVTLIPCYSETATFLSDCRQHFQGRPGREFSRRSLPLVDLTAAALAGNPAGSAAHPGQRVMAVDRSAD